MWGWDRKIRPEDHRLASLGLPSDDKRLSRGTAFLSDLTRIMNSYSCSPLITTFYIGETQKRLQENPEFAEMWHGGVIHYVQWHHRSMCDQRAVDLWLFVFYVSHGLVRVCEIEISHMGKNSGNTDLVCKNIWITHAFSCINICQVPRKLFEHEAARLRV